MNTDIDATDVWDELVCGDAIAIDLSFAAVELLAAMMLDRTVAREGDALVGVAGWHHLADLTVEQQVAVRRIEDAIAAMRAEVADDE